MTQTKMFENLKKLNKLDQIDPDKMFGEIQMRLERHEPWLYPYVGHAHTDRQLFRKVCPTTTSLYVSFELVELLL